MKDYLSTIESYHAEIWANKDVGSIDRYFAQDARVHTSLGDAEGTEYMKGVVGKWIEALPDMEVTWKDSVCQGQKVVARWSSTGTHTGEFLGYAPTGKKVSYNGVTIYGLNETGKIEDYWAFVDMEGLRKQLTV